MAASTSSNLRRCY